MYEDEARAREHAYREAFESNVPTFEERARRSKRQKRPLSVSDMGF